ncbi:MAG TPA: hypothetical protein VJQ54_10830 [Candidatus Sulfotelmatobacter sp.]|nr:hypothetical protein [Candidatus Sulfotelmatobacter sp.]
MRVHATVKAVAVVAIALVSGLLFLPPTRLLAEDFLERMKKAAAQLEQQQQRQRMQPLTQPQSQPSQSPQAVSSQPAAQAVPTSTWMNECCTPEATAKMATSAGFVDVVGVKLGMTGEQAMAALKEANPKFKIDVIRSPGRWDYLARLTDDSSADPTKQWVIGLQANAPVVGSYSPETINVGMTTHPNQSFVYVVSRVITFQEGAMPAAENVLAGLRKKYGPESYPVPAATGEGFPDVRWVFDTKGQLVGGPIGKTIAQSCGTRPAGVIMPDISGSTTELKKDGNTIVGQTAITFPGDPSKPYLHCEDWVVLRVVFTKPIITSPLVSGMESNLWHLPLYVSGLNATYTWADQLRKAQADKKLKEADKVMPKF